MKCLPYTQSTQDAVFVEEFGLDARTVTGNVTTCRGTQNMCQRISAEKMTRGLYWCLLQQGKNVYSCCVQEIVDMHGYGFGIGWGNFTSINSGAIVVKYCHMLQ